MRFATSGSLPASQMPWNFAAMAAASGRGSLSGAKLGLSGQKPVSRTPTMTPSPAWLTLPNCLFHTPFLPSRPRNLGVDTVSVVKMASFQTWSTPGVDFSRAASLAVIFMAKPFIVTSYTSVTVWPPRWAFFRTAVRWSRRCPR